MTYFKVTFVYPDGHVNDFEDRYQELEDAIKFGNNHLVQVVNTERYHKDRGLFSKKPKKPYFQVNKVDDGLLTLVYDSRN